MRHIPIAMHTALIAIGGNVADVSASIAAAFARLAASPHCRDAVLSRIYATAPMGKQAGPPYRNAAIRLETTLDPLALLDALQNIELELGRVRTMHWGPRIIDLDLIGVGDCVVHEQRLTLPHPGLIYRRFVLDPLLEIAPDWVHPQLDRTVRELHERLMLRPLPVQIQGASTSLTATLQQQLQDEVTFHRARLSRPADPDLHMAIGVDPKTSPRAAECISLRVAGRSVKDQEEMLAQFLRAALDEPVLCQ